MTALTPFTFDGHQVRVVVGANGAPLFVLADVCRVLDIGNARMVAQRLDPDDVSTTDVIDSMGRTQQAHAVTEAGVIDVTLDSRKPDARRFRRWLTHDVVPQIMQTGSYSTTPALPQDYPSALRALADSAEALESERAARAIDAPKAHAWEEFMSADGDFSVNQAAKTLSRRSGTIIGSGRLWKWLEANKWTYRDYSGPRAYQRRVDAGLLVEKPNGTYTDPHTGEVKVRGVQVRVLPKGIEKLDQHLSGQFELDIEGAAS